MTEKIFDLKCGEPCGKPLTSSLFLPTNLNFVRAYLSFAIASPFVPFTADELAIFESKESISGIFKYQPSMFI